MESEPLAGKRMPPAHVLTVPDFALVVLLGRSAAHSARFAARHFRPREVVVPPEGSFRRGGGAPPDPRWQTLREAASARLRRRGLTVLATAGGSPEERRAHVQLARRHHALPVAVILDAEVAPGQLEREGFRQVHLLAAEAEAVSVRRRPLWSDRREEPGPFDIIGDVHGCADELEALLDDLGYRVCYHEGDAGRTCTVTPPHGRKAVFVGDLVDRGPRIPDVLRLVMSMVAAGTGLCAIGNHDDKLLRWLRGADVKVSHGLEASIEQLEREPPAFRARAERFLSQLPDHYWLDDGRLCVAHAGLTEELIGRASGTVRAFALYGDTTGERDRYGLPVRGDWAAHYRGDTRVVYGHTPVLTSRWRNNTLCLDTGCVFGGSLTALRYPEDELVSVPARRTWFEPLRPFGTQ